MRLFDKIKSFVGSAEITSAAGTTTFADKTCAWAKKIADGKAYKYKKWTNDKKTHECPICNNLTGKYKGWNCIGFAFATWHHGGGLKSKCNCGVITNAHWEKILKAKIDAEATKIAQDRIGIKDVKVIRNGGKIISTSKLKKGDIIAFFNGNTYTHTALYIGNGKMADSSGGQTPNIKYGHDIRTTCKVAIRYVGESKNMTTSDDSYPGTFPSLTIKKTNGEVINDAITWAKWIAGDNRFHYGYTNKHGSKDSKKWSPNAHHNGCYFCGTNTAKGGRSKKGVVDYQFTYCCNPFVGAAWAHGGCVKEALDKCQKGGSWDFHEGQGYDTCKLFKKLGKPATNKLKAGDVLCSDSHVALYIGDGKVVHASGGDDNVKNSKKWNNSIRIGTWSGWKRAYRFTGSVDHSAPIRYGEVSARVRHLQLFLNWAGYNLIADGIFGDKTLEIVKDFQTKYNLKVDGIVGSATLSKIREVGA